MEKEFSFKYQLFESVSELSESQRNLMEEAEKAMENAYAPYSKFKVGVALLLDDGSYLFGSNQENKAYPSGLCAERTALFALGAQFPNKKVIKLAITSQGNMLSSADLLTPCGSCRQVMAEVTARQKNKFEILMKNHDGSILVFEGIDQLLPFTFGSEL